MKTRGLPGMLAPVYQELAFGKRVELPTSLTCSTHLSSASEVGSAVWRSRVWSGSPMGARVTQGEVSDHGVVVALGAVAALTHVVVGPPVAEVLVAYGKFADQLGELRVVGVLSSV